MKEFVSARKAGVPLIAISTSDPEACLKSCVKSLNGKADETPVLIWDIVNGAVPGNEAGGEIMEAAEIDPMMTLNPTEFLGLIAKSAAKLRTKKVGAVIFMRMANRLLEAERIEGLGFVTGVFLCRDAFKANGVTLVMLAPTIVLPAELKQDIVVLDEPLPNDEELAKVCEATIADAELKPEVFTSVKDKVVSTLRGLSAFAAEQTVAQSLTKNGINTQELMRLKRGYIGQLPGVEVREDKTTFDDIAGYETVKNLLRRKIAGKRPPRLTIWWDEFDRTITTKANDGNTSSDQMATLLGWLQDRLNEDRLSAAILVGVPGSAKSAIASATHNEAGCECLRWDLGGAKDSLVGSSEKRIRNMLKVCDAMCGGHILILATANSLDGVPSPVISRFALGTYFFNTPTEEEGKAIWKLKRKKYGIPDDEPNPTSDPWSGREIQQCCFIADDLRIPLADAAKYITPYFSTNAKELESLRNQAHNRWLSASHPGFYKKPADATATGRKMSV